MKNMIISKVFHGKLIIVILPGMGYNVHVGNEPCVCNPNQIGCLQTDLVWIADIGRSP